MDGAGHLLLPRARFSFDQHCRRGLGKVTDQLEDGMHAWALAENIMEGIARSNCSRNAATSSCSSRCCKAQDNEAQVFGIGGLR